MIHKYYAHKLLWDRSKDPIEGSWLLAAWVMECP